MSTFGERLYDSLVMAGMPDAGLAARCGVSEEEVTIWLKMDEAKLSGKDLATAGLALGISCRWLALGTGSPTPAGMEEARREHAPP